ncbi:serine/threonine-protein kinase psk1 [Grosmannia clavigera kw1407]|uniref:Serine/threonine-protein kinase psk1 n=1 Tax=Grosmannia clavigera (strain kw1407 / UAMH 11150) TaxID=655863 RepID=F0XDD1_GROCL|nr:serine/threonine-protein kinase psk1 [Grosmannia clavigera kw1407]EFX03875.1 serine/threonine-protein kinase psk1 [Grosmannia clavigera kw1407]
MDAPLPARTTVRGFQGTPVTSGDEEDSDYGVGGYHSGKTAHRRGRTQQQQMRAINDVVSTNCSPQLRPSGSPAVSGIAKLRMQLEPLSLDTSTASSRATSPVPAVRTHRLQPQRPSGSNDSNDSNDSNASRTLTGVSSRSTSHGGLSSNTSDDEASRDRGDRTDSTSYVIQLGSDFISESAREDVRWTAQDALAATGHPKEAGAGPGRDLDDDDDPLANFDATTGTSVDEYASKATPREHGVPPAKKMTADDFEPLRCLGKGSYGTVLLVKHNANGRLYAQKQFKKASLVVHKKLIEQTKTERQILESVNRHPFVVKLFYAFQDREKLYLILEYGQGGELFTHLSAERMFSESTAGFYMAEMVLALSHLHDTLGVVYRDLKPENCLLDADGHLLLTDFGLSKVALPGEGAAPGADDSACCHSILGTVEYMAPEVVQGQKYGRAVDWWSLGALGYDLLTGNPPFRGRNNAKIQDNIVRQKLVLPYFLGPDAKDLLTRLLQKNPRKRLGANMPKDLTTLKGHRFFRKIDWQRLAARQMEPPIQPVITDPELAENFASEFTDLPMSPVVSTADGRWDPASPGGLGGVGRPAGRAGSFKDDPFGGFSFVASTSLLNEANFPLMA